LQGLESRSLGLGLGQQGLGLGLCLQSQGLGLALVSQGLGLGCQGLAALVLVLEAKVLTTSLPIVT